MQQTHFKVVLLDETHHYNEEFIEVCGGKIMRSYLFDSLQTTNCCELTPSYALIPLSSSCPIQLPEAVEEELWQVDADTNDIVYIHCRTLDQYAERYFSEYAPYSLTRDQSYAEVESEYEEAAKCNQKIACPWA